MTRALTPEPWTELALCAEVDFDIFFPEQGETCQAPKRICGSCPVAEPCRAYALKHEIQDGVWGGMSPRERRALRRTA